MYKEVLLKCTPLIFYTQNDEDLLFNWFDKIKEIKNIKGIGEELHVHILSAIPNNSLLDLMGIFDRYKFDATQLKVFMNESNKEWFE